LYINKQEPLRMDLPKLETREKEG